MSGGSMNGGGMNDGGAVDGGGGARGPAGTGNARLHAVLTLAARYRQVFAGEAGRLVLDDLARCYDGSTVGASPRQSELRAAQRDVLLRIRDLITLAEADHEAAGAALAADGRKLSLYLEPWSGYVREQR